MLKQRIITALILAPVAMAGVFFLPPIEFSLFIGLILAVAAWEWANLAGYTGIYCYFYSAGIVILLVISWFVPPLFLLIPGILWWCLALYLVVRYPQGAGLWSSTAVRSLFGVFMLIPGFISLVQLKLMSGSEFLILLLFLFIRGADVGAYFFGRALGQGKLAPEVSPGKSWAGFYGGLITALVIAIVMAVVHGSPDLGSGRGIIFLLGCAFVVMISVVGDLAESMFKRNRGIKDSSNLLPGHGGILDRIDSLLSAGPAFALFILSFGWM
ncbi:MAG: phosphatidate cytidylyltransferase [Pseudohongiellaceae bacterium]